jgi:hypothetical protein
MKKHFNYILLFVFAAPMLFGACQKTNYTFGQIKTPTNVVITATIQGATATNPTGDGTGKVTINVTATNALAYKIFFGNSTGDSVLTTTGQASETYVSSTDTTTYTVTVNAIGTGGATTTAVKQIKVLYQYQIPAATIADLTNGSSKNWVIAKDMPGHFGVGPSTDFTPDYYSAPPEDKASYPCAYSGIVTFNQSGANSITMNDNNASSFLISASTSYYGQPGNGDGCYTVSTGGTQTISIGADMFAGASNSGGTGLQVSVPGSGLIGFGTGATTYEILTLTATTMELRDIGADGNAWYQILKAQ